MKPPSRYISPFEIASQNLRNLLAHMYAELKMPPETIELQVRGMLTSFQVQEKYEQRQPIHPQPEGS